MSKIFHFYINLKYFIFNKLNSYLNKRVKRFFIKSNIFIKILKKLISSIKLVLRFFIFMKIIKYKMLYLFYYYRHLNNINFKNLFVTIKDLIEKLSRERKDERTKR